MMSHRCDARSCRSATRSACARSGAWTWQPRRYLEQQLEELRDAGFRRLIVDLGGLWFMDSTGLQLALKWHGAARRDGFEIGFAPGPPAVQRVFKLTGMTEQVPFIDS
jgi:anti-anti-sigma factor